MPQIVKLAIGAGLGAGTGFLLYRFVGCASGACPIWSSPWLATLYGAGLGALLAA
ncbi:MAG: DUF6132 family protein [candidate division FCPU426 bacterium]